MRRNTSVIRIFLLATGFLFCALFINMLVITPQAQGEPYIAIREGLNCTYCHVNRTGGGIRTQSFRLAAKSLLHYPGDLFEEIEDQAKEAVGELSDRISLGANVRMTNTTTFRDEPDEQGRVPNNKVFRPVDSNDFDVDEAVLYGKVDLIKEKLIFYVDESFAPGGARNREIFGLLTGILPWNAYVKAGKFFPSYGLRIQDDAAFIRSTTGFNFDNPDKGVELGIAPAGLFLAASITNGTDTTGDETGKQLAFNTYYLFEDLPVLENVLIGGSFSRNDPADKTLYGLYMGFKLWKFTALAEGDLISEKDGDEDLDRLALYAEVNWLALDWLNVKAAYDWFDPDRDTGEDQRDRVSLGLESFLAKYMQLRLFYRVSNDIPQRPQGNVNELTAELHLFF